MSSIALEDVFTYLYVVVDDWYQKEGRRYMQPSVSTIGTPRLEWGTTAVRQLIDFLENETPFQPQRIPTRFLPRQSSTLNSST